MAGVPPTVRPSLTLTTTTSPYAPSVAASGSSSSSSSSSRRRQSNEIAPRPAPATCCQRCIATTHRVLASDRIPVVADFVEDKVVSRCATVFLVLVVITYLLRAATYSLFLVQPVGVGTGAGVVLFAGDIGNAGVVLGSPILPPLTAVARVADTRAPVKNAPLVAVAAYATGDTDLWVARWGLRDTLLDDVGVPLGGRYSLPGFVPRALAHPVLSSPLAVTGLSGTARFSALALAVGLPARYIVRFQTPGGEVATPPLRLEFTSTVAAVAVVSAPVTRRNTTLTLGSPLPLLAVRVADARGAPLSGRTVVLLSAPPTPAEWANLIARPDLLLPRAAVFNPPVPTSAPTGWDGIAYFPNVSVNASASSTVRAEFVCEGVRSSAPVEFRVRALTPTPDSPGDAVSLTLVTPPDAAVLEGVPFTTQPAVRVTRRVIGVGGAVTDVPVPGIRVIALPATQAGLRTPTLMSPPAARALNVLGGSVPAALAAVGQAKLLFNATSAPSDATGVARWSSSGFISHGPAGVYTLVFAVAGLGSRPLETPPIVVSSSVASVEWAAPPSLAATVCNFPACGYPMGGAYGSAIYTGGKANIQAANLSALTTAAGPSGYFPTPPALRVLDGRGRVLAGKSASSLTVSDAAGAPPPAGALVVQEFPYPGAATSVLSTATTATAVGDDGALVWMPRPAGLGDDAMLFAQRASGVGPAYLRVTAAPPGVTQWVFAVVVEGVASQATPLVVTSADVGPATMVCSNLAVVATPPCINMTAASFSGRDVPLPLDLAFVARALTSRGTPVAGINVSMHLVEAVGLMVMRGGNHVVDSLRQEYVDYLRAAGGAAGVVLGDAPASWYGLSLLPTVAVAVTNASGHAVFRSTGVLASLLTYVRYAFTATYAGSVRQEADMPPVGACVSPYTPALPVFGEVESIAFGSRSRGVGIADGATQLTPVPPVAITLAGNVSATGDAAFGVVLTQVDAGLTAYPPYVGVLSRRYDASSNVGLMGYPAVRVPGDVATSPLLPGYMDALLYGTVSPFVSTVAGSMSHTLRVAPGDGGAYLRVAPSDPLLVTGAGPGGAPLFPNVSQAAGTPGDYSYVVFSQGVLSEPWEASYTDGINTLVAIDYPPDGCPSNVTTYYHPPAATSILAVRTNLPPSVCLAGCGGPLRGRCVCGVCVCQPGWDGNRDCTATFDGDAYATLFANDPQYASMYGGLPVVDIRRNMETYDRFMEGVPRFLLARAVVAATANLTVLAAFSAALLPTLRDTTLAPATARLGDAVAAAIRQGVTPPALALTQAAQVGATVMPILVDCAGAEVSGPGFRPQTPILDTCSAVHFPLSSDATATPGVSTFDAFKVFPVYRRLAAAAAPATATAADVEDIVDRRLAMLDVPTGCYRLRYVYAPRGGGGSLATRTVASPLRSAQAVSIGASRPFRVLSPVITITLVAPAGPVTIAIPRGGSIGWVVAPTVALSVRAAEGNASAPLFDPCQTQSTADLRAEAATSASPPRCPDAPYGGLPVYVTAVSTATGLEYPLYASGSQADCARAAVTFDTATGVPLPLYAATFPAITFPQEVASPATAAGGLGAVATLPADTYNLKFTSYGTSLRSSLAVTVVDSATGLALQLGGAALVATVGAPMTTPLNVTAYVNAMADGSARIGVAGVTVTAVVAWAPVNSNIGGSGTASTTDGAGVAGFPLLQPEAGASGIYILRFTAPGVPCNASSHIVALNVTNPVHHVEVGYSGTTQPGAGTSYESPLTVVAGATMGGVWRVCPRGEDGSWVGFANDTASLRFAIDAPGAALYQYAAAVSNATDLCTSGPADSRTWVRVEVGAAVVATGVGGLADGCLVASGVAFAARKTSIRVAAIWSVRGVEAPPIHLLLQSARDAHPVSFDDIKNRIPLPFAIVLAPLASNALYRHAGVIAVAVGAALFSVAVMWNDVFSVFLVDDAELAQYYESVDVSYVMVETGAYVASLTAACVIIAGVWVAVLRQVHTNVVASGAGARWLQRWCGAGCCSSFASCCCCRAGGCSGRRAPTTALKSAGGKRSGKTGDGGGEPGRREGGSSYGAPGAGGARGGSGVPPVLAAAVAAYPPAAYYVDKAREALQYSAAAAAHARHPLLVPSGLLHPAAVQCLTRAFLAIAAPASLIALPPRTPPPAAAAVAKRARALCGTCRRAVGMRVVWHAPVLPPAGARALRAALAAVHCGLEGDAGLAQLATPDAVVACLTYRLARGGVLTTLRDVRRIDSRALPPDTRPLFAVSPSGGPPTPTRAGIDLFTQCAALLQANGRSPGGLLTLGQMMEVVEPSVTPLVRLLDTAASSGGTLTLLEFLTAYTTRLHLACDVHARVTDDAAVWAELAAWGVDARLRAALDARQPGLPAPWASLLAAHFSRFSASGAPALTYDEMTRFRAAVRMPAFRRDYFATAAAAHNPAALDPGVVPNPLRMVSSAAGDTAVAEAAAAAAAAAEAAAGGDGVVGPQEYWMLAGLAYSDRVDHMRTLVAALGYAPSLLPLTLHFDGGAGSSGGGDGDGVTLHDVVAAADDAVAAGGRPASGVSPTGWPGVVGTGGSITPGGGGSPAWRQCGGVCRPNRPAAPTAFHYPQRFLVAVAVSLLMCGFMGMLLMSAQTLVDHALVSAIEGSQEALSTLQTLVAQQAAAAEAAAAAVVQATLAWAATQATAEAVGTAVSTQSDVNTMLQLLALGSDAAAASGSASAGAAAAATASGVAQAQETVGMVLAVAAGQVPASNLPPGLGAAVASALGDSVATAAEELPNAGVLSAVMQSASGLLLLAAVGVGDAVEVMSAVRAALPIAAAVALSAAALAVIVAWVTMLTAYRARMLAARRGVYPFVRTLAAVGGASNFVGVQAGQMALSFGLIATLVWIVVLAIHVPVVQAFLVNQGAALLLSFAGAAAAITLLQMFAISYLLTTGALIRYRRLFMLADTYFQFANLFVGLVSACIRIALSLPFIAITLMRCDESHMPPVLEVLDMGKAPYNSMFLVDSQYSHPIALAAAHMFIASLLDRRTRAAHIRAAGTPGVGDDDADGGDGGVGNGRAGGGVGGSGGIQLSPLAVLRAAGGGGSGGGGGVPAALLRGDALRQVRARNRWHLAVQLTLNPSLARHRVRGMLGMASTSALVSVVGRLLTRSAGTPTPLSPASRTGATPSRVVNPLAAGVAGFAPVATATALPLSRPGPGVDA